MEKIRSHVKYSAILDVIEDAYPLEDQTPEEIFKSVWLKPALMKLGGLSGTDFAIADLYLMIKLSEAGSPDFKGCGCSLCSILEKLSKLAEFKELCAELGRQKEQAK